MTSTQHKHKTNIKQLKHENKDLVIKILIYEQCDLLQSPSFKFSRKASSSYSLKLEPPSKQKLKAARRKPLSTPASPSRAREPQCTCMTAEQYARLRAQDPRYRGKRPGIQFFHKTKIASRASGGSSTLPRATTRATDTETRTEKVTAATSSTSLYDNVGNATGNTGSGQGNETRSAHKTTQNTPETFELT